MMTNFQAIRELLGMTQAALAQALGRTQGSVYFYEKGKTVPPEVAGRLIQVAKAAGHELSFDDIYRVRKPAKQQRSRRAEVAA